jgi:hypothetical protein
VKVVYGTPKTVMAVGMTEVNEIATPFIAFVDREKVDADPEMASGFGDETAGIVEKVHDMGGVVIYFDNPPAAQQFMTMSLMLFNNAMKSEWSEIEMIGEEVQ